MKISIITVCFNSAKTIEKTIQSLASQTYNNIEHIIVDGNSKDATLEIIKKYENQISKWISEPDKGLYDAMNKGVQLATGDVIGILNSDDFYTNNTILSEIAQAFSDNSIDAVFGDIHFVRQNNLLKSVRKYSGKTFRTCLFRWGFMPPHPSFFVRKIFYEKFGAYDITFDISGDYELMVRFLYLHKLKYKYLNIDMVAMRLGGASTKSLKTLLYDNNRNVIRACRSNGVYTNIFMVSVRYIQKIVELFNK